jgi:hypothetical protein
VELVALAVWVGGLIVIVAAVIPAVFNSFGMEPGGRFLTRLFSGYNRLVGASAILLAGCLGFRRRLARGGRAEPIPRPELWLLVVMAAVAGAITFWLGPESVELQEQAFRARDEAAKKAAYDAFFRTHHLVRGLYVVNLLLGVAVLAVKVKAWQRNVAL